VKASRILHASVNVTGNLEEARQFYEEVLGMSTTPRPEVPGVPGHWFAVGDAQVHLVAAPPLGTDIDPTANHFCIAVDDIEATVAELEARGVPYLRATQGDEEVVQVWVVDPAGNTVELQQDRVLS
jgi:catechol 2,3-dioxygenase-like lactoylglutathione lyase family enzyme